jgi:hypothetical protein
MKLAGLQKVKSFLALLSILFASLLGVSPESAFAATVGSGTCQQVVDNSSNVAVAESGEFCYIAFKAGTRAWTTPSNVNTIDYLVVAGGGSGGARHGGGGGAGGLLKSFNVSITNVSSLNITVGNGGASVAPSGGSISATGLPGGNSSLAKGSGSGSFSNVTAIGGGGGEAGGVGAQSGGSGGGGQYSTAGSGTAGQGNSGGGGGSGNISGATNWWAGGGGGAGSVGASGSTSGGGNGGSGAIWISSFTTTIATSLGLSQTNQTSASQVYFAGGGGGAITLSYTPGTGGLGGGGAAVTGNNTGFSGTANSGGGGGGTGCCDGGPTGAGGSGIVLIRYSIPTYSNSLTASVAENSATSTNIITISVNESSTLTLLNIVDSSFFNLVYVDGFNVRLRFNSPPDFEAKSDSGANNEYDITIRATNSSGNFRDATLKITVTDVLESGILSVPSLSAAPQKGRAVTITITSDAPGKIRFFVAGKKIPNCLAQSTSGTYPSFTATCQWKPANLGYQSLRGTLTPSNLSIGQSSSPQATFLVTRRSNNR